MTNLTRPQNAYDLAYGVGEATLAAFGFAPLRKWGSTKPWTGSSSGVRWVRLGDWSAASG